MAFGHGRRWRRLGPVVRRGEAKGLHNPFCLRVPHKRKQNQKFGSGYITHASSGARNWAKWLHNPYFGATVTSRVSVLARAHATRAQDTGVRPILLPNQNQKQGGGASTFQTSISLIHYIQFVGPCQALKRRAHTCERIQGGRFEGCVFDTVLPGKLDNKQNGRKLAHGFPRHKCYSVGRAFH